MKRPTCRKARLAHDRASSAGYVLPRSRRRAYWGGRIVSVKRGWVIAVVVLIAALLYAPNQTMHFVLNFRDASGQLFQDLGLHPG